MPLVIETFELEDVSCSFGQGIIRLWFPSEFLIEDDPEEFVRGGGSDVYSSKCQVWSWFGSIHREVH